MPPGLTSPFHLLAIAVVALVVLGPDRLPHTLGRVGSVVREYRRLSELAARGLPDLLAVDPDRHTYGEVFRDSAHPESAVASEEDPEALGGCRDPASSNAEPFQRSGETHAL